MLCAKLVYPDLSTIMQLVGYTEIEVKSLFANLVAIIQVAPGQRFKLEFYHTSLYDTWRMDQDLESTMWIEEKFAQKSVQSASKISIPEVRSAIVCGAI